MSNGLRPVFAVMAAVSFVTSTAWYSNAWACPFCDAPTTTFSEQLSTSHVAALVKWVSAVKPDVNSFAEGTTVFEIIESAGKHAADFPAGSRVIVPRYHSGKSGAESLLFATSNDDKVSWGLPSPISRECWQYIVTAPARSVPREERLPFYLGALEHADPDIAMDAFGEFAGIDYTDLKNVSSKFSREKINGWLADPLTIPTRKGLYGLMLGLCGNEEDARYMAGIIREQPEDSRMGIDGMMAGYLLLTGREGMTNIVKWKIDDPKSPDHEILSLLKTLEFMWTYGHDRVDATQLKIALRQILIRPQLAGLVILDLARWKDWSVMDQLATGYGKEPFADRHPRQCIVRFLIVAAEDAVPDPATTGSEDYATRARVHLARIREMDPDTVRYVEKHSFD